MRAQVDLLIWLVNRWDTQDQCFLFVSHRLEVELEDIYFLTGLSKRGRHLSLFGTRPSGQSVASLKAEFCNGWVDPKDKWIDIICPEFKVIVFTVTRLYRSAALRVANLMLRELRLLDFCRHIFVGWTTNYLSLRTFIHWDGLPRQ